METQLGDGIAILAAMATPVVLLLANAMLILSTNQRLQSILDRVRETELAIAGKDVAPEIADLHLLNELPNHILFLYLDLLLYPLSRKTMMVQ